MISTEATYQDCVYSRLADDCYWKCRMHERWIGTTSLLLACRRLHNRWNASNWKNFDGREEFHQSSPNASDLIPWGWRNETILKRTFNHRSILCPFGSVLRKFATWSYRCNFAKYSKVSIIRPGCSRLLEFEKKDSTGRLKETFSKYPDQVVYRDQKLAVAALK